MYPFSDLDSYLRRNASEVLTCALLPKAKKIFEGTDCKSTPGGLVDSEKQIIITKFV
jgi:hypothetical protein